MLTTECMIAEAPKTTRLAAAWVAAWAAAWAAWATWACNAILDSTTLIQVAKAKSTARLAVQWLSIGCGSDSSGQSVAA
jgi:hypothetical protein